MSTTDDHVPEFASLNERQKLFVLAIVEDGMNHARAAEVAGYEGNAGTLKSTGHRLSRDPRVAAAIVALGRQRLRVGTGVAVNTLIEICEPGYPPSERIKAAKALMDRGGLPAVSETNVSVTHSISREAQIAEIAAFAEKLGISPTKLLGRAGFIDAQFSEAPALAPPDDDWTV